MFILQNHFLTVKPVEMKCRSHDKLIKTDTWVWTIVAKIRRTFYIIIYVGKYLMIWYYETDFCVKTHLKKALFVYAPQKIDNSVMINNNGNYINSRSFRHTWCFFLRLTLNLPWIDKKWQTNILISVTWWNNKHTQIKSIFHPKMMLLSSSIPLESFKPMKLSSV